MPVTIIWTLTGPVVVSPFSPPPSLPPIIGSLVSCDATTYSQDTLLSVAEKAYPAGYFLALKDNPRAGYELFQCAAKVMERISIAIARRYCCSFVMFAAGGTKASGEVEFYRTDAGAGALTVRAGSVVRTGNRKQFVTTEDAEFGGADLGPHTVAVTAITEGFEWNVAGRVVTDSGISLEGDIFDIEKGNVTDIADPNIPLMDLEMRVRNLSATGGGADKCLDALGQDLNMPRAFGESDDAYRLRIQTTPNTVSPAAIKDGANDVLNAYGKEVCLREVGTPLLPGIFYDGGGSTDSPQVPANNYAYDMDFAQRPEDRFKLFLSTLDFRGFFLLGVPKFVESNFPGLIYDTVSGDSYPIQNAYDTTAADALFAAYDGVEILSAGIYKAISDATDQRRAAGVGFDLYFEEIGCF